MARNKVKLPLTFLILVCTLFCITDLSATTVILQGKITMLDGGGPPANIVLRCYAEESFSAATPINSKDGTFSFSVDVHGAAALYNMRFLRSSYDIVLSAAEPVTEIYIKMEKDQLREIGTSKSRENDAYKAFRAVQHPFDIRLRNQMSNCEKEDSCEKTLHDMLTDFAGSLATIQNDYKGTYTADVLCKMRMPSIAKNIKSTSSEFRRDYFENVPFADSTIFNIPVYKEMITDYIDFVQEPSLSKENQFIKYFTDKIKSNPVVLRKSAGMLFDELLRKQKEKMMGMFITWYNTGDNKTTVNNPVLDIRLRNISHIMPGQPYIDASGPDTSGTIRSLKEVVDKSKCTLLLFWSSECSHCRDEMPFIQEYYKKYHAKGFDVYAISLESDHEKWKAFIKEKGLAWTNVTSNQQANPNPAMQYVSTSTPTMVLIDHKGIILHRFIQKQALEKLIIEALE